MVRNPNRKSLSIDVKGLYKKNDWVVRQKEAQADLYYVFAYVPPNQPNEFFILTQEQVNQGIDEELQRAENAARQKGRQLSKRFECVKWNFATKYKDLWDVLLY